MYCHIVSYRTNWKHFESGFSHRLCFTNNPSYGHFISAQADLWAVHWPWYCRNHHGTRCGTPPFLHCAEVGPHTRKSVNQDVESSYLRSGRHGTHSFISQHAYLIKKYIGMGRSPIRASDLVRKKFLPRNKVHLVSPQPIKAYPVSKATSFLEALNRIALTEAHRGGIRRYSTIHPVTIKHCGHQPTAFQVTNTEGPRPQFGQWTEYVFHKQT